MNNTTEVMDNDLIDRLATRTDALSRASRAHEAAYILYVALDNEVSDLKLTTAAEIADDRAFSNDILRKAELSRRMKQLYPSRLESLERATRTKYETEQEVERTLQEVKTMRVIVAYMTAQIEREALTVGNF